MGITEGGGSVRNKEKLGGGVGGNKSNQGTPGYKGFGAASSNGSLLSKMNKLNTISTKDIKTLYDRLTDEVKNSGLSDKYKVTMYDNTLSSNSTQYGGVILSAVVEDILIVQPIIVGSSGQKPYSISEVTAIANSSYNNGNGTKVVCPDDFYDDVMIGHLVATVITNLGLEIDAENVVTSKPITIKHYVDMAGDNIGEVTNAAYMNIVEIIHKLNPNHIASSLNNSSADNEYFVNVVSTYPEDKGRVITPDGHVYASALSVELVEQQKTKNKELNKASGSKVVGKSYSHLDYIPMSIPNAMGGTRIVFSPTAVVTLIDTPNDGNVSTILLTYIATTIAFKHVRLALILANPDLLREVTNLNKLLGIHGNSVDLTKSTKDVNDIVRAVNGIVGGEPTTVLQLRKNSISSSRDNVIEVASNPIGDGTAIYNIETVNKSREKIIAQICELTGNAFNRDFPLDKIFYANQPSKISPNWTYTHKDGSLRSASEFNLASVLLTANETDSMTIASAYSGSTSPIIDPTNSNTKEQYFTLMSDICVKQSVKVGDAQYDGSNTNIMFSIEFIEAFISATIASGLKIKLNTNRLENMSTGINDTVNAFNGHIGSVNGNGMVVNGPNNTAGYYNGYYNGNPYNNSVI